MDKHLKERFGGIDRLYGSGALARFAACHLTVVGIGGPVTFERANRLRGIVAAMPLEQLLLETDSPDQPGAAHRGERNEPAYLVEVLDVVARLRGVEREAISEATARNAERLFKLTPPQASDRGPGGSSAA